MCVVADFSAHRNLTYVGFILKMASVIQQVAKYGQAGAHGIAGTLPDSLSFSAQQRPIPEADHTYTVRHHTLALSTL